MLYPSASCVVKGEEEIKVTLLQKKRNQLAGYCKLVTYGVLDLVAATDVFKYYNKVGRNGHKRLKHFDQPLSFLTIYISSA